MCFLLLGLCSLFLSKNLVFALRAFKCPAGLKNKQTSFWNLEYSLFMSATVSMHVTGRRAMRRADPGAVPGPRPRPQVQQQVTLMTTRRKRSSMGTSVDADTTFPRPSLAGTQIRAGCSPCSPGNRTPVDLPPHCCARRSHLFLSLLFFFVPFSRVKRKRSPMIPALGRVPLAAV